MDLSIRFLILVLLGLVLGGSAQVLNATDLLDKLEASLLELVTLVQANALNSCDLLSTCNAESTCSRLSCPLTNASTTGYACQEVQRNTNCKDNCPWRNYDYSRSVVSVAGVNAIGDITPRQLQEICAQKNLDNFFQKHSNNTNFFSLYFGSVDGTFRFFPGMDELDCGIYDPRTRLWYLTSTAIVTKAVMVLIDGGYTMANLYRASGNDSDLIRAFKITESFLKTTTQEDYVNIFTFYEAHFNPFSPQPVQVTDNSTHPEFGIFSTPLSTSNKSTDKPGNNTEAISKVITSSAGFNSANITSDYLKVILLITDSNPQAVDAINNAALPWDLIKNNSVSVFLYVFNSSSAAINVSPLASQLCAARGYFEILNVTVSQNPLLALEAYYSFVANVKTAYVNNGIDYTPQYGDFSDVDNQTFTLSKPVFSSNGQLLGVAAIDIFKTKVLKVNKITESDLQLAIDNIAKNKNFNASAGVNTTTCLIQTSNKTCTQSPQASNIVCSSIFGAGNTTLQDLSCCGTCDADAVPPASPAPAPAADKPPILPLALGLGLGLGIPALTALIALIAVAFIAGRRMRNRRQEYVYTGND